MSKKRPAPVALAGLAGETYTITVTLRGLRIELDERHRLVYTSFITDNVRSIRFDTEPVSSRAKERIG